MISQASHVILHGPLCTNCEIPSGGDLPWGWGQCGDTNPERACCGLAADGQEAEKLWEDDEWGWSGVAQSIGMRLVHAPVSSTEILELQRF
jgi:hypothetical protein